jgi:hypothetical protein
MERNIRTFDLSSPLQAFHFATFLVRLRAHSKDVQALFRKQQAGLIAKVKNKELERWTKEAQIQELGEVVQTVTNEQGDT